MGIGIRLKMALREKKMTIKELSARTNISLNTLYSITKRDSEKVDALILDMISGATGLSQSFFCGLPPFEDLALLDQNKDEILSLLVSEGLLKLEDRVLSDIERFDLWVALSDWVSSVSVDKTGKLQVMFSGSPPIILHADSDISKTTLLDAFSKLCPSGQLLVIEYAELLASNPGFQNKSIKLHAD